MKSFDDFEAVMKDGARVRREKEESRLTELRQAVILVEAAVKTESSERVEAAKALQSWTETQIISMRARLEELLQKRSADTAERIVALEARCKELEEQFERDKRETLAEVDKRNQELVALLNSFKTDFESEKVARLAREQSIHTRIGAAEHATLAQWNSERGVREQVYMALKAEVEEAVSARDKADNRFQNNVFAELTALKNALQAEALAREAEDAALAGHINSYVAKLQASLAVISTDDDQL